MSRLSKARASQKPIIALVYDFDKTLCPRNMQEYSFLPQIEVEPEAFWSEVRAFAEKHEADPLIAYMRLMYLKAKEKNVKIGREDLVAQGKSIAFFEGVEQWFELLNKTLKKTAPNVELRHYLISAGLKEIVEGTSIYSAFHNVFASEYMFHSYEMPFPKRVVTDTSKTQYLFRINKGVEDLNQSINSHMAQEDRPIPFSHMIYFGDGESDVPSMTVAQKNGGSAIAVYEPSKSSKICEELYQAERVDFFAEADYREGSTLHTYTLLLIDRILADINIASEQRELERQLEGS